MARYFELAYYPGANCGTFTGWRLTIKEGRDMSFLEVHDLRRIARAALPPDKREVLVGTRSDDALILKLKKGVGKEAREKLLAGLDAWVLALQRFG